MKKKINLSILTLIIAVVCFASGMLMLNNTHSVMAGEVAVSSYVTDNELVFENGASIRKTAPSGIRFMMSAEKLINQEGNLKSQETGVIIVPSQVLEGKYVDTNWTVDIFDYIKTTYGKDKNSISTKFENANIYMKGDKKVVSCAIVNLAEDHYLWDYSAVVYHIDGSVISYSKPSDTRTIAQVADASRYNEELTAEDKTLIDNIINVATKESDIAHGLDLSKILIDQTVTEAKIGNKVVSEKPGDKKVNFINDSKGKTVEVSLNDIIADNTREQTVSVTLSDGTVREYKTKIWTSILKTPQDLLDMNKYEIATNVYSGQSAPRHTYGLYKLANDIDMTKVVFKYSNILGDVDNSNYGGFRGLIDGQGHTISNLEYENAGYMGLVYALCRDSVVENINVECSGFKGLNSGVIASCINGGTIRNVKISVDGVYYTEEVLPAGAIVGSIANFSNTKMIFENITAVYTGKHQGNWTNFKAIGVISGGENELSKDKTILQIKNCNLVGFNYLSGIKRVSAFAKLEEVQGYATCENVNVYADVTEFENAQKPVD